MKTYREHIRDAITNDFGKITDILIRNKISFEVDVDDNMTIIFVDNLAYKFDNDKLVQICKAGVEDWYECDINIDTLRVFFSRYYRKNDCLMAIRTDTMSETENKMKKYGILPMIKVTYIN